MMMMQCPATARTFTTAGVRAPHVMDVRDAKCSMELCSQDHHM